MNKEPAFWDASALVPLCVHEIISPQARSYLRRFLPVVWWGSVLEVRSTVARLHRTEHWGEVARNRALSGLNVLSRTWKEVPPTDELRVLAGSLLDVRVLRAADSLQLAAALIWCDERPTRRSFVCADQRLSEAASSAGFSVVELSRGIS